MKFTIDEKELIDVGERRMEMELKGERKIGNLELIKVGTERQSLLFCPVVIFYLS